MSYMYNVSEIQSIPLTVVADCYPHGDSSLKNYYIQKTALFIKYIRHIILPVI